MISSPSPNVTSMLDVLCPMHVVLNATGHVVHTGPTLTKVFGGDRLNGKRFLELFELKRPKLGPNMQDLLSAKGKRLHFMLRHRSRAEMKGVLLPLPENGALGPPGGALINLSFGISVVEAVQAFNLSDADFAITDLTVELLYLVEAKSAAMQASRKLNTRLQGAKIAAEERAYTDTLTGLRNRRALEPVVSRLIEAGEDFALMQLDLDHFKAVNDTKGHAAGDHVLREVAEVLREETRDDDTIIRVGGDEFVLIFATIVEARTLAQISARLIERLQRPIDFNGQACRISGSMGSTLSCQYEHPNLERMMEDADLALYQAKSEGRGRQIAFDERLRGITSKDDQFAKTDEVREVKTPVLFPLPSKEQREYLVPTVPDRYR
ncbi:diguanylate cyclase domain-containing protein [Roseovarius rhodophyticola]|uniref:guanylate cyclase n=1 Tax=Roseovarius rhodophyticola TaxID=3080827 RepID=A0ABZ2TGW2_9RHOB|nr:diguanylate cyclase [Roseovarius sp. W115]MDV2929241.1 diguanylate cyclase [Roseovarius sp. W115]